MAKQEREELRKRLKGSGICFVRWALAGSYDSGGIVEIKTYDSTAREINTTFIFNLEDLNPFDRNLLEFGEQVMEGEFRGFEINDGGYGWIAWGVDGDTVGVKQYYNHRGMDSEGFNRRKFDRVEIAVNQNWSENDSAFESVIISVFAGDVRREVHLSELDKAHRFLTIEIRPGMTTETELGRGKKRREKSFFEAGGFITGHLSESVLRTFLHSIDVRCSERFYFKGPDDAGYSHSQGDFVGDHVFKELGWPEYPLAIFIGGWCDDFEILTFGENEVIEENPPIAEILKSPISLENK